MARRVNSDERFSIEFDVSFAFLHEILIVLLIVIFEMTNESSSTSLLFLEDVPDDLAGTLQLDNLY